MILSDEQRLIVEASKTSTSNLLISACAGGAKTTTMCAIASARGARGDRVVALAFNKDAAESLSRRMPYWVQSTTFHAFCYAALRAAGYARDGINARKVPQALKRREPNFRLRREIEDDVVEAITLAKAANEIEVASFYSDEVQHHANAILTESRYDGSASIDFDDMLYLTAQLDIPLPRPALVLLDEAQDTNPCQLVLLERMLADSASRLIAVGDPHQSIYAFRGADHLAMPALQTAFAMTEMSLSVSYRCSKAVVEEAKKYLTL